MTLLALPVLMLLNSCNLNVEHPPRVPAGFEPSSGYASDHHDPPPADSTAARLLRNQLGSSSTQPSLSAWPEKVRRLTGRFYASHDYGLAWMNNGELSPHARSLLTDLCRPDRDGLEVAAARPASLTSALDQYAEEPSDTTTAELDFQLTAAFMRYSDQFLGGRVDPEKVSSEVYIKPPRIPLDSVLTDLLSRPAPKSFAPAMLPGYREYERLEQALVHYREISDEGGWPAIDEGHLLKPKDTDGRVPTLRRRLAFTGDMDEDLVEDDSLYDTKVQAALAHFQRRHGLEIDSLLGPATLKALNVPVEDRIRQIELSLEHWRWLPRRLGERYVIVNIPAFEIEAYDHGEPILTMKTVVGAEMDSKRTPVFSDLMEYVVFRPYWYVPEDIVRREIVPHIEKDASYLKDHGYEVIDADNKIIDPRRVDLDEIEDGTYRVRQLPGRGNSLGLVKFVLPNRHNIYLHDTPADYLFDKTERDFSHGCIRLEDPVRFAEFILGPQGWSTADIESAMEGERQVVNLETPVPVYIVYLSAFVAKDGTVSFRDDIYGFDAALDRTLAESDRRDLAQADTSRASCEQVERALDKL
ncbi:MAG: L,D-transpeptidase family protein [Rhodothermales bacterium]